MKETIVNLQALGFTNYESRVFHALFKGHVMTATEIAREAKIPRSSAYDILKSFAAKGICNEINTSSIIKYELIDPEIVQDKIEKELNDDFKKKISNLQNSFKVLQPLFLAKTNNEKQADVKLLKGFNNKRSAKFHELIRCSSDEVLVMYKNDDDQLCSITKNLIDAKTRGCSVKLLMESSNGNGINHTTPDVYHELQNITGYEMRIADKLHQNFAVIDNCTVFISLHDPETKKYDRSDIIVNNCCFADSMKEYFELYWEKSKRLNEMAVIDQDISQLINNKEI